MALYMLSVSCLLFFSLEFGYTSCVKVSWGFAYSPVNVRPSFVLYLYQESVVRFLEIRSPWKQLAIFPFKEGNGPIHIQAMVNIYVNVRLK